MADVMWVLTVLVLIICLCDVPEQVMRHRERMAKIRAGIDPDACDCDTEEPAEPQP